MSFCWKAQKSAYMMKLSSINLTQNCAAKLLDMYFTSQEAKEVV